MILNEIWECEGRPKFVDPSTCSSFGFVLWLIVADFAFVFAFISVENPIHLKTWVSRPYTTQTIFFSYEAHCCFVKNRIVAYRALKILRWWQKCLYVQKEQSFGVHYDLMVILACIFWNQWRKSHYIKILSLCIWC